MILQFVWTDLLFKNYNNLVNFADAVDRKIKTLTTASVGATFNTMEISNRIIDLMQKKVSLCNAKVLVEKVIKNLDKESARILILRYIDNHNMERIAKLTKQSVRTVYRKFQTARDLFAKKMLEMGYDDKRMQNLFEGQLWIYNDYIYEKKKLLEECPQLINKNSTCQLDKVKNALMEDLEDKNFVSSAI